MSELKACTKCKIEKQRIEFSKDKRAKDGLQSQCKACDRAYRAANAESIGAYRCVYRSENEESISAQLREYREENKETLKEKRSARYAASAEAIHAKMREYYVENAETLKSRAREYRAANPEKVSAHNRNRRARVRKAEGSHTAADVRAIFEYQRGKCAICPKRLFKSGKDKFHVDHIQPLSKGGSNDKYNLQCLCPECNLRKSAKDPLDWAKEIGKLL